MAWILNIETTTTNCSVSLSENGSNIAMKEDKSDGYSHSENLHRFISELIDISKLQITDLDAIAISEGPGSYTGLRIGLSAAKGLCYALNIPLIAISTLDILANSETPEEGMIIPMIDARRMEVYSAVYNSKHQQLRAIKAEILDEGIYEEYLDLGKVYFVGNANEKAKSILKHDHAIFSDFRLPSSKDMVPLSYSKYKSGQFEDVAYFEPNYLKEFKGNKV